MRAPTDSYVVHSAYGEVREHNVHHWGEDIVGPWGEPVKAPESGVVERVAKGKGTAIKLTPPFDGYGPGVVLIHGDSGVWHLLAHVDPASIAVKVGERVTEGATVAKLARAVGAAGPHVHWEVRVHQAIDSPSTREGNTVRPAEWLDGGSDLWSRVKRAAIEGAHEVKRRKVAQVGSGVLLLVLLALVLSDRR